MSLRPIKDNILVEPIPKSDKVGQIFIVGEIDNTRRGNVLKVGADVKEVSEGDVILYYDGQGLKFNEDRKDYILIREGEISLIL